MKNLKITMLALGMSSMFAFGACGGDDLGKVKGFVDDMCKCKDKACYDKVEEKAKKAMDDKTMEKLMKDKPEEMGKLMGKMMECAMKLEAPAGDAPAPTE